MVCLYSLIGSFVVLEVLARPDLRLKKTHILCNNTLLCTKATWLWIGRNCQQICQVCFDPIKVVPSYCRIAGNEVHCLVVYRTMNGQSLTCVGMIRLLIQTGVTNFHYYSLTVINLLAVSFYIDMQCLHHHTVL